MAVIAAACGGGSSSSSGGSSGSGKPLVIGISLSLSGDFSDPGHAAMRGYQLWADSVNKRGGMLGRKVELKIVDDASEPEPGRHQLPDPDHPRQGRPRLRPVLDAADGAVRARRQPLRLRVPRAGRRRPAGVRREAATTSSSCSRRRSSTAATRSSTTSSTLPASRAAEDRGLPVARRSVRLADRRSRAGEARGARRQDRLQARSTRPRRPT